MRKKQKTENTKKVSVKSGAAGKSQKPGTATRTTAPTKKEPARADKKVRPGRKVPGGGDQWNLKLYIAGQTPKSIAAFSNLKKICEEHLKGKYDIEIVDLLKNPQLARGDQILALPTLVRKLPEPIRKIIGDLSDTQRVLVGLDLKPR